MLNGTEECFSLLKHAIRKKLARQHEAIIATHDLPWEQRINAKVEIVLGVVRRSLPTLTPGKVTNFCNHVLSHFVSCSTKLDL